MRRMDYPNKTSRLFFALWPDKQTRQSIVDTFSQFPPPKNARVLQPHNLHITLHFIGQVTDETKHNMHLAAQKVNSEKFVIDLGCFGYFSKAKIFWMGCNKLPSALPQLRDDLGNELQECGYKSEASAYTPHVSLMPKCSKSDAMTLLKKPPPFSIPWPVNGFVLVESKVDQRGGNYTVIERYPFLWDQLSPSLFIWDSRNLPPWIFPWIF